MWVHAKEKASTWKSTQVKERASRDDRQREYMCEKYAKKSNRRYMLETSREMCKTLLKF